MNSRQLGKRLRRLQQIYDCLPQINCKRECQNSCGPIIWTRIEHENIRRAVSGNFRIIEDMAHPACPYLQGVSCSIYNSRPLVCRLFGGIRATPCKHGCQPDRWLSDEEVTALYDEIIELWRNTARKGEGTAQDLFPFGNFGPNRLTPEQSRVMMEAQKAREAGE